MREPRPEDRPRSRTTSDDPERSELAAPIERPDRSETTAHRGSEPENGGSPSSQATVHPRGSDSEERRSAPSGRSSLEVGLPAPGDQLGDFRIEASIGAGGMGAVFRALDQRLDRPVALKVLPPMQALEPDVVSRFYQEGKSAAQLDHENIARVYSMGHDQGLHYIAFEYIEGTTLRDRVDASGPLPVGEVLRMTLQIAEALDHAASRSVVHRDVKPSNIIVDRQGRAKLVDMGLARRFERDLHEDGLTHSAVTLGTFDYISPEQGVNPKEVDARSDLYSLGCTIFHVLTGSPPYPGGTAVQKILKHREAPIPDIRERNPEIPAEIADLVRRLMSKDPNQRFQSPAQLIQEISALAAVYGHGANEERDLPIGGRGSWWRGEPSTLWIVSIAALLAIVAIMAGVGRLFDQRSALSVDVPTRVSSTSENRTADAKPLEPGARRSAAVEKSKAAGSSPRTEPEAASGAELLVRSSDDLRAALNAASSGSTIVLVDDGLYRIGPPRAELTPFEGVVTIRAASDVRPVLIRAPQASTGDSADSEAAEAVEASREWPLLAFGAGRVTIEGIEVRDETSASITGPAIRAEGTALTLSRCGFFGTDQSMALEWIGPSVAEEERFGVPAAEALPLVKLDACHFGGFGVGIRGLGSLDLRARDCTFATRGPVVWLDNRQNRSSDSGDSSLDAHAWLDLRRSSLLAPDQPLFRFEGTTAHVRSEGLLVAPAREDQAAILTTIDEPTRLDWSGRGNLYARVEAYLLPLSSSSGSRPIDAFDEWADGPSTDAWRESSSSETRDHVWASDDPSQAIAMGDAPATAFRPLADVLLVDAGTGRGRIGARRGPNGRIEPVIRESTGTARADSSDADADSTATANANEPEVEAADPNEPASAPRVAERPSAVADPPAAIESVVLPPSLASRDRGYREPVEGEMPPTIPPSLLSRSSVEGRADAETEAEAEEETTMSDAVASENADREGLSTVQSDEEREGSGNVAATVEDEQQRAEPTAIRTTTELLDRLEELGSNGGLIELDPQAELTLPVVALEGRGRWEIRPAEGLEADGRRPRLTFEPSLRDLDSSTDWPALFQVERGGHLSLKGVDLVLEAGERRSRGRWAALRLESGATLDLDACTVTIRDDRRSAVIRVISARSALPSDRPALPSFLRLEPVAERGLTPAASIQIEDSLLRAGHDIVDVQGEAAIESLRLTNTVVASAGSLLHAHGRSRTAPSNANAQPENAAQTTSGFGESAIKLTLRGITAVTQGGLVWLESQSNQPVLPAVNLSVIDSILTTGSSGEALFRIDGQEEIEELRDLLRYELFDVAYHRVWLYRRDQTAYPGELASEFDLERWESAFGEQQVGTFHGDIGFLDPEGPEREPRSLTAGDLQLEPTSPAADLGARLEVIPQPPLPPPEEPEERGLFEPDPMAVPMFDDPDETGADPDDDPDSETASAVESTRAPASRDTDSSN